jgi:hypothetical protein
MGEAFGLNAFLESPQSEGSLASHPFRDEFRTAGPSTSVAVAASAQEGGGTVVCGKPESGLETRA